MTDRINPFAGAGEVRELARSIDWEGSSLGPVADWSEALRSMVATCLASPFPICLWCGPELVIIYNDAYREVLGAKHPEALGRPGPEVWAEIWPQIAPMFEQIRERGPPVFEEDAPFLVRRTENEPGEDAAGTANANAWFTFSLSPVREASGEIVAFLNIVAESTGRVLAERAHQEARAKAERAEARLRDVFSGAPSFLAVLRGPRHVFEYVNQSYYQLVGHRELLGRPAFEALPEARGQGFEDLLNGVLETGEPFVGREVPITIARTPDAPPEELYLDFVYYPITEPDGTRSGVVAHGSDVTEHVLARREAQRARAQAEEANRAKSQFLATMSHEIRTPINAVMGYADLLDARIAGELSGSQQDYVDGIQTSSRHLLGLVSDILDLAKIEAGEVVGGGADFPLHEVVQSALRIITPQAERKGIPVSTTVDCDAETRVRGDQDRIRQIILNLLSNALKFTDEGGSIGVRCRTVDRVPPDATLPELGPWVVVDVEDTGRGISAEELPRVFDPFVQGETGHTRRTGGTGLGLTISRRLARFMGGELTVQSELGQGSCFSLWLAPPSQDRMPAGPESDRPEEPEAWPPEPHELPGLASAGRTLLSVLAEVEECWVQRLRSDPIIRGAESMNAAQLADQTAELLAAMAKTLFVLEEGGGDRALLKDAEAVQAMVATRHGQQRRRVDLTRAELEREYQLLGDVLDATLRREAPKRTAANLGTALGVVSRLVDRAAAASLRAFDGSANPGPERE